MLSFSVQTITKNIKYFKIKLLPVNIETIIKNNTFIAWYFYSNN